MNKLTGLIFGGAALAAVGLASAPMAATPEGHGPGNRSFAHGNHMRGGFFGGSAPLITIALQHKSELNLSGDQVANLEKIKQHYQGQVTPLHQQLRGFDKEIASLAQQAPANLVLIKTKIQESEKLRSELRYLQLEALENGRSVLSTAQRDQLKTLVAARQKQGHHGHKQPS